MAFAVRDDIIIHTPTGQSKYEFKLFAPGAVSAVAFVLSLLTVTLVFLRYRSRRVTGIGFKGDDWTIFTASVFAVALCALCIADTVIGAQPGEIEYIFNVVVPATSLEMAFGITIVYATTLGLIKISMLLLYKRIFTQRWLHNVANLLIGLVIGYWMFFVAAVCLFSVKLYRAFYDGTSRASWESTQAVLILDVALDIIILVLPTPIIWGLQLSLGRKIQVLTLFATGGLWMIATALRYVYLSQSVYTTSYGTNRRFFDAVQASFYLTMSATCIGICHACLPTLKPLIDQVLTKHPRFHPVLKRFHSPRQALPNCSKGASGSESPKRKPKRTVSHHVAMSEEWRKSGTSDRSETASILKTNPVLHDKELADISSESNASTEHHTVGDSLTRRGDMV